MKSSTTRGLETARPLRQLIKAVCRLRRVASLRSQLSLASCALATLLLVHLGLTASLSSAAVDPMESDVFRFTWLGVPIGEVTLHYSSYQSSQGAAAVDSAALTGAPLTGSEHESLEPDGNKRQGQDPLTSPRLGALVGQTNGLVRWLKRYEGAYKTTLTTSGVLYEVTAMDQGVPETRKIWFGSERLDIPQVLEFKDRSSAHALQSREGVDEGSVDPVSLMASILEAIELHQGCPTKPLRFRVFDGKRRYQAELSGSSSENDSGSGQQAKPLPVSTTLRDHSSSPADSLKGVDDITSGKETVGIPSQTSGVKAREMAGGVIQTRVEKALALAPESSMANDRGQAISSNRSVACRLTLSARDLPKNSLVDAGHLVGHVNGELAQSDALDRASVYPGGKRMVEGSRSEEAAQSRLTNSLLEGGADKPTGLALSTEVPVSQQGPDRDVQRALFWPFNRRDLTVDFSASLKRAGARFESFVIRAPVGYIKGQRQIEDSERKLNDSAN